MNPKYWFYEGNPAVTVTGAAYVYRDGEWQRTDILLVLTKSLELTQAKFLETFGELPPSPLEA